MKTKITLSALVLAGFYNGATAQTPGYTKTAIYDDFNTTEEYTDQNPADPNFPDGIYWWGKAALGVNPNNANDPNNTVDCYLNNKYAITRPGNGKLQLSVSQGSECWEPMGVSTVLDLSADATFEVSITNNSTTAIYFDIYIADANKKIINCSSTNANFSLTNIPAGATQVLKGDFKGGKHKAYPGPTYTTGLDLSKVVEVDFTVVNAEQPETNNWGPLPISDVSVSINYLKVGKAGANSVAEVKAADYSVYPNPTNGDQITFSKILSNVKLVDASGAVVLSAASASELNISALTAGFYFLQSDQGAVKVVKQ